jgi:DNA-binding Lrp family transcriptional regulator
VDVVLQSSDSAPATVRVDAVVPGPALRVRKRETDPRQPCDPQSWPPIVVERSTLTLVDGHRRVRAAKRFGWDELTVEWFDGDEADVVIAFVRLNMRHDDELDREECREATRCLLSLRPEWSDRRVAELCHISPKTVAVERARLRETGRADAESDARIGRDGRVRPLDARAQRARIAEAIKCNPRASLRSIARPIGVSPETVRRVRAAMENDGSIERSPFEVVEVDLSFTRRRPPAWKPDTAFTSQDEAAEVATFLERTDTSSIDPEQHSRAIPLSRVYEVADEARRRAAFWQRMAELVENRARKPCY